MENLPNIIKLINKIVQLFLSLNVGKKWSKSCLCFMKDSAGSDGLGRHWRL